MKSFIMTPVENLKEGDLVDLEGDRYADQAGCNPLFECELMPVTHVERETDNCVTVYFEGFDMVGFPVGHPLLRQARAGESIAAVT